MAAKAVPKNRSDRRRGAVVMLVAVTGAVMVGFTALTIDIGNMCVVRTELQRAADAAALAAVSKLGRYHSGSSERTARDEAQRIVQANPVDAKTVSLDLSKDVEFGQAIWNSATAAYAFTPGGTIPNAVRVTIRKTKDSPNGALHLFFANFFGSDTNMKVRAAAMLAPRDIAVVADLSGSMSSDSQLPHYQVNPNLWNIWVCLPIEKGNNGVGNGIDPPPPGNPPLNDGYGTSPGDPGNRGGADPKLDPGLTGPTWGRLHNWGTLEVTSSYDPTTDPGLEYLPYKASWNNNVALQQWYQTVGYNASEIGALSGSQFDQAGYWKYRAAVALGLARWDSGKNGGLSSMLPDNYTKSTKGNSNDKVEPGELAWLVEFPFKNDSSRSDASYWLDYIDTYMRSTNTSLYQANANFACRFGPKTFVNYLLESWRTYSQCPELSKTPEQPLQAVKDSVRYSMDLLTENECDDHVSLEVYASTAYHVVNLTRNLGDVATGFKAMQAAHYDAETNLGGGIGMAIKELSSSRARRNASKIIFLMTDGNPNVTATGAIDPVGGQQWALTKAKEAIDKHIQFYCVSIGPDANRILMEQIASNAGGEAFDVSGSSSEYSAQLQQAFSEIGGKRGVRLIE